MAAPVRVNNSFGALGADPGSGGTTITFAIAPSFATLTGAQYIRLVLDANTTSFEIVHLTAYTSGATTGTMSRGQDGTTGVAHPTGNYVGPNNVVYPLGTWQCGPTKEDYNFAQMSDFVLGNNGEVMVFDSAQSNGFSNAAFGDAKQYNDLLGWSMDPLLAPNLVQLSGAAQLFLARIPLSRSTSVSNLVAYLEIKASSTLTHSFLALFRSDGTIVGQSADQSADWGSGGVAPALKTLAIVGGPFTVTPLAADDFVWVGIYCGTAAVGLPYFSACQAVDAGNAGTSASRSRFGLISQADTATLASITPASISPNVGNPYFVGLS